MKVGIIAVIIGAIGAVAYRTLGWPGAAAVIGVLAVIWIALRIVTWMLHRRTAVMIAGLPHSEQVTMLEDIGSDVRPEIERHLQRIEEARTSHC